MQHVLRCRERQSDGTEYKKTLRRPVFRPGPRWRILQRSRKPPSWWGGAGCPSSSTPSPALGTSGLASSTPTPKLVPTPLLGRWFQIQWFDSYSTAIRPRYNHSTTFVTNGLLQVHCSVEVKAKEKLRTLDTAPIRESSPQKRSVMARRVLRGSHSFTCMNIPTRSSAIGESTPAFAFPAITGKGKGNVKMHTLDIAPLRSRSPPQKRSGMTRVLKGFHSLNCKLTRSSAIGMSHTCLCLPSRSWYSVTDPGGMEGWVGINK